MAELNSYVDDCVITTGAITAGFLLLIGSNNQRYTGTNRGEILNSDPETVPNLVEDNAYWHDVSCWVTYYNLAYVVPCPLVLLRVDRLHSIREWARLAAGLSHEVAPLVARGIYAKWGLAVYIPDTSLEFSATADHVMHVRGMYERR